MSEISKSLNEAHSKRASMTRQLKIGFLAAASVILLTLTWWLTNSALYGHKPLMFWVLSVGGMIVWISSICFFILVNNSRTIFAAINVVGLAAYLLLFPKDIYVIAGGLIFFFLSLLFQERIRNEEKNQLNFSIRRTVSGSLVLVTYAFLFLIGFNIYSNTSQDFKNNPEKFYDKIGETAAKSIPFVSESLAPDADLNQSLDDYLTDQAKSQNGELDNVPPSQRETFLQEQRDQFLRQFGIEASGHEQLAIVLSRIINEKAKEVLGRFERFFPLIFTLIIVALMRTFSFVFHWLTIFVTWLLYKLLLALKFFRIAKVTVEVDQLDI